MKKNKAGEKEIAFGAVGSAQEAALQRHLSKALSRCKMWSQGGAGRREVKRKNNEKVLFNFWGAESYSF